MANECNIRVMCRFRPLNDYEERAGSKMVVKFPGDQHEKEDTCIMGGKCYVFDKVFRPDSTQEQIYCATAKEIVDDVLSGYNGTIFAYGQTSSGKTHTMEGVLNSVDMQGIIPRIVQDVFNHIYSMDANSTFQIKISYFEIYMDKIRDLMDVTKTNLSVHEDINRVPYVKGATERFVITPDEVFKCIEEGKSNRHIAVTNMNEHSSRSHSVFLINVTQDNTTIERKLSGKLYLVDLAGSEKVSKTGAEGAVLEEAKNINKSLSALSNVISALADCKPYVPYRDSKLTRILQESLGGNARTTIVICCSPASYNESESKSTLQFGQRAKTVTNVVVVNEELTVEEWKRKFEKEKEKVGKLKGALAKTEIELGKWRQGEVVKLEEQLKVEEMESEMPVSASETNLAAKTTAKSTDRVSNAFKEDSEREKQALYSQLDEKDDEINNQLEKLENYNLLMIEQEELINQLRIKNDDLQMSISSLESKNEAQKDEVKEVLRALEELAINYDQKHTEAESKSNENITLTQELDKKLNNLKVVEDELDNCKEVSLSQRKRILDMMVTLLKDLGEIGVIVGGTLTNEFKKPSMDSFDTAEEDFTMARLYVSKLKGEIKILKQRCAFLDEQNTLAEKSFEEKVQELEVCRLNLVQNEARLKSQQDYGKDLEGKKRKFEEELDVLREDMAKIKAQESIGAASDLKTSDEKQQAFTDKLESHIEQLKKQMKELRDENDVNQTKCHELKDENQNIKLAFEKLQNDYEKLRKEESDRSIKLKELLAQQEMREQAKQDLKGLEETVAKELQSLHNLRKLFVQDLQVRLKKSQKAIDNNDEDTDISNGNIAQKQKIAFLENNLEQLTKVHKQLVRDNADLRCELPKLEKRLKATMERVKSLEVALKEAKEGAMKDRKRYQHEVERIKEAVRQRSLIKKGNMPSIVKPIRGGATLPSQTVVGGMINRTDVIPPTPPTRKEEPLVPKQETYDK